MARDEQTVSEEKSASDTSAATNDNAVSNVPDERTVEFPTNRSLGELYLVDAHGKTQFHGDALGTVKVPSGKFLALYYSFDPSGIYGCSLLSNLKPDALYSISFLGTEITDSELVHVGKLTGLRELDVSCSHIGDEGVALLKDLHDLRKINLSTTEITTRGIQSIAQLTTLEELVLDDTELGDEALAIIASLQRLTTLSLSFTEITNKGLSKLKEMKQLERLRLNSTDIDDDGMVYLSRLINLSELWLRMTKVTYPGLVELTKWLPNCEIII